MKTAALTPPNDAEEKIDWHKMGGDHLRNLRGNDTKRLKHAEKGA